MAIRYLLAAPAALAVSAYPADTPEPARAVRAPSMNEYLGEAYPMDRTPQEAEKRLAERERICGNQSCEEYADLAKSIAGYTSKNRPRARMCCVMEALQDVATRVPRKRRSCRER